MATYVSGLGIGAPKAVGGAQNGTLGAPAIYATPVFDAAHVSNQSGATQPLAQGGVALGAFVTNATAAIAGFVNDIQLGGSTAPYIPVVQGAPARPSVGQLWPRGR